MVAVAGYDWTTLLAALDALKAKDMPSSSRDREGLPSAWFPADLFGAESEEGGVLRDKIKAMPNHDAAV